MLAITFQTNYEVIWAYPFVTKTPVGTKSLLRASDDQRYKFWDDFLFVKSCTKIIPKISEKIMSVQEQFFFLSELAK